MAKNVCGIDRVIRAVGGVALIAYAMSNLPGAEDWMVPAGMVGFILVLTSVFAWCPVYLPFGFRSCKAK